MATVDVGDHNTSEFKDGEKTVSKTSKSPEDSTAMAGNTTKETVPVEFNLSDPEQLARQLDRVDLTEEESDELLREAHKVNKQLRQMLKQKQDKVAASLRTQSANSNISQRSRLRVLPPIHSKEAGSVPQKSMKAYGKGSAKNASSAAVNGKSAKSKSAVQRPVWDDRFSCS